MIPEANREGERALPALFMATTLWADGIDHQVGRKQDAVKPGPVEYLVVYFEGKPLPRRDHPALGELVDSGQIRIIDLAVIIKDAAGDVLLHESSELDIEAAGALAKLEGEHDDLLSEEDLLLVAEDLP